MVIPASPFIAATHLTKLSRNNGEYEIQQLKMPRWLTASQARKVLTDQEEYGGWELWRLRRYRSGSREAWLRRKVIGSFERATGLTANWIKPADS